VQYMRRHPHNKRMHGDDVKIIKLVQAWRAGIGEEKDEQRKKDKRKAESQFLRGAPGLG
jgi:hypothetical protein